MSTQDQTPSVQALQAKKTKSNYYNPAMRDKLQQVFNRVPPAVEKQDKLHGINVNRIGLDGEEHIHLDFYGATEVGKLMAMNMRGRFDHPVLGNFLSFKGLWYFLNSYERDDRMRELTGMALDKFNQTMTPVHVPNVAAIALTMLYKRITADIRATELVAASTLPFDCYWVNEAGLRRRQRWAYWLVPGAEEIRRAIKANVPPDFSAFIEQLRRGETLEDYIMREFLDPDQREIAAKNLQLKKERKAAELLEQQKIREQKAANKQRRKLERALQAESKDQAAPVDEHALPDHSPQKLAEFIKTIDQEEAQAEQSGQQDQAEHDEQGSFSFTVAEMEALGLVQSEPSSDLKDEQQEDSAKSAE